MISLPCAHRLVMAVEKLCPGERVIAGPYMVEHPMKYARDEEKALAVKALRTQTTNGQQARIVMHRKQAFVLRPIEGWRHQGKHGQPVAAKKRRAK